MNFDSSKDCHQNIFVLQFTKLTSKITVQVEICMLVTSSARLINYLKETAVLNSETRIALPGQGSKWHF
jgi:hypothetical protein